MRLSAHNCTTLKKTHTARRSTGADIDLISIVKDLPPQLYPLVSPKYVRMEQEIGLQEPQFIGRVRWKAARRQVGLTGGDQAENSI